MWKIINLFLFALVICCPASSVRNHESSENIVIDPKNIEPKDIDPIEIDCYQIYPDTPIKPYKNNTEYTGRVTFEAKIDTTKLILIDYKIMFAKLRSRINPLDTIEIRMNDHVGNYKYLKNLAPKLIEHLSYLKLIKINQTDCASIGYYYITVMIK
jgi:hypothetical protein